MSWANAIGRGLVIVLYFAFTTVWLPNFVIHLRVVEDAPAMVSDLVVVVVWGGALVAGMYLLRLAQRRGLI